MPGVRSPLHHLRSNLANETVFIFERSAEAIKNPSLVHTITYDEIQLIVAEPNSLQSLDAYQQFAKFAHGIIRDRYFGMSSFDREEVVADILWELCKSLPNFKEGKGKFVNWFRTIVHNRTKVYRVKNRPEHWGVFGSHFTDYSKFLNLDLDTDNLDFEEPVEDEKITEEQAQDVAAVKTHIVKVLGEQKWAMYKEYYSTNKRFKDIAKLYGVCRQHIQQVVKAVRLEITKYLEKNSANFYAFHGNVTAGTKVNIRTTGVAIPRRTGRLNSIGA